MAIVTLGVNPSSFEFSQILNDESFRDASGGFWVSGRNGNRWGLTLTFTNLTGADRRNLWATVGSLQGQRNQLRVNLTTLGYVAAGAYGGSPQANGVQSAGATSLVLDGAAASVTGWSVAGDFVGIENQIMLVTADADSDGSGNVTLPIWPPITNTVPDGLSLTITPSAVFYLIDAQGLSAVPFPGGSEAPWRSPTVVLTLEQDVTA